ncbi:MAG: ABC transporter permease subunit [Oscillospiraceae bacterium]
MKKINRLTATKQLLVAFFAIFVVAPLAVMLFQMRDVEVWTLFASEQFQEKLHNSLFLATTATICSVSLALLLAFCVTRSNIKHKNWLVAIFTLPMLIPSISHGMGLIILFGANGIITNLFHLKSSIYGFGGVLLGSVLYSFPVAYLMLQDVLQYEDYAPYEAAQVLGIPHKNRFFSITLPYLKRPMISVVFAVFTLVITDYGVPLMIGGKFATLPVMMYQEVIGLLNFGKGSVIGAVLLVPALVAFITDLLNQSQSGNSFVVTRIKVKENLLRDRVCIIFCVVVCSFVLLPIVAFCAISLMKKYPTDITFSLYNLIKTFKMNAGIYLRNSLIIAACVSVVGTVFAYITAYISSRTSGKSSKVLHLFSITSMAIPGLVLGLSYALFFKSSFLYGTILILILVDMIHFFSSPYLMAYNSFNKVNENLEAVGATLGVSRLHILMDVIVPQTKETILEMFSYFFVNCMMTISAVSFLYTTSTMPVSLLITQFEAQMLLECSAFISIVILGINLILKASILYAKRKIREN